MDKEKHIMGICQNTYFVIYTLLQTETNLDKRFHNCHVQLTYLLLQIKN
jgi:hypothetical protein